MATIVIGSSLDAKGFNECIDKLDTLKSKTESVNGKLSKAGKFALASISGSVTGIAGYAVNATSKLEDANVQLENAFKNAGTSVDDHKGKLASVQAQMEKFGYSNAQSTAAIARMTTVTGSADKAMASMGLAADIAKNRHMDLDKAGDLLSKTMAGNMTAAKRMGIAIPESVQKIQDPAEKATAIMGILQGHFKGSANAAANTFGGKMEAAKAKASDFAASIGSKLVPIVLRLVDVVQKVVKWLSKHKEVLIALSVIVGTVVLAVLIEYTIGMFAAAAATLAATWPILLIIGILALLVLGVMYAWKHFGWFRTAVMAVWHGIQKAIHFAWNDIIKPVFHAIGWYVHNVLVPIFKFLWHAVKTAFHFIMSIISGAWDDIKKVFNWIKGGVTKVLNFFKSIPEKIGGFFSDLGNTILSPFKWAFNKIGDLWNNTVGKIHFTIPSWVPVFGGKEFHMPKIPHWKAVGGSVMGGDPYIVGEQGPELFVPGGSGTIVPNHRLRGGGGGVVQHITVVSNDPQQVVNALIRYQQRNGSIPIRTRA